MAVANPNLLGCFNSTSYTERSILSMFIGAEADAYIGSQTSSFFKGMNMLRGASRKPGADRQCWVYDHGDGSYLFAHEDKSIITSYEDACRCKIVSRDINGLENA